MRVLLLKQVLFTSEMVVQDDLVFQVLCHLIADLVGLLDPLRDRAVPCCELIKSLHLMHKIFRLENELVLLGVLHKQLLQYRNNDTHRILIVWLVLTFRLDWVSPMIFSSLSMPNAFSKALTLSM